MQETLDKTEETTDKSGRKLHYMVTKKDRDGIIEGLMHGHSIEMISLCGKHMSVYTKNHIKSINESPLPPCSECVEILMERSLS